MPKPIGNMVLNVKSHDKVSYKVRGKFESKASEKAAPPAQQTEKAVKKYKERKKK